ncbi:ABC transporter permease [Amycolatopsis sp. NPDC021455]|uniref:ABC transporter permease n=1 Tax=Amycolatopsis sp. NPDC021455 TaxID=3154901 RepID=UPI0033DCF7F9
MTADGPLLDLSPGTGRAPLPALIARQAAMELRLLSRRIDSLVVMTVPPVLALFGVGVSDVIRLPTADRLGFAVPGAIALAVMASAFVGLAVSTGYERGHGVLKRLGASALPTWGLLLAKMAAAVVVIEAQVVVLAGLGVLLGWRPHGDGLLGAVGLVALATAAFAGVGLIMAGRLRAETTSGAANLAYLVMIVFGDVVFPLPTRVVDWTQLLPVTALAEGLRSALSAGAGVPVGYWSLLGLWAVLGLVSVVLWFRWE